MHATLNQRRPAYLSSIIKFNREESGRRHLRSSTTNAAVVMRTRTQFGKRAFSVCGPSIWNQIHPHIRNLHSAPAFREALKTFVFGDHLDTVMHCRSPCCDRAGTRYNIYDCNYDYERRTLIPLSIRRRLEISDVVSTGMLLC